MAPHLVVALAALSLATSSPDPLDSVAAGYVKLVLAVGRHAPDYVDAYFGPSEWKAEAERAGKRPLPELAAEADRLLAATRATAVEREDVGRSARRDFLAGQLAAVCSYVRILNGERLSFDEEARALYGIAPPARDLRSFERVRERLAALLPGDGPVPARFQEWKRRLAIPKDRIEEVMRVALEEVRRRTLRHVELPRGERFSLAIVTGKPWGAYNWYRGSAESHIEIDTGLPVYAFAAVSLMAHEGYPGHHVFNALQETRLAIGRGAVEHTIYPLQSPISLIAEGSAEAGVELVFPEQDRIAFERDVLFPLAGVDPAEAARASRIRLALKGLEGASTELTRRYLDGSMSAAQVKDWLAAYRLATPEEAAKFLRFAEGYRSYVVNYDHGEELVAGWLRDQAGEDAGARWRAFVDLLGSPRLPSSLRVQPAR